MYVRIVKREGEVGERALLVARREDGREYTFTAPEEVMDRVNDLIVNVFEPVDEDHGDTTS